MPIVGCKICQKSFYTKPSWLKNGVGIYCSIKCQAEGRKTGGLINCFTCGKKVYKQLKAINKSKSGKNFCTKACTLKWHNHEFKESSHGNWKTGEFAYKRILERSGAEVQCVLCGTRDSSDVCVHHVDWDRKNNNLKNLTCLCRNWHHLVHNYKDVASHFPTSLEVK